MPILGKEHPMTPLRMHTGYLAAIAVVGLQLSACASYVAKAPEESAADAALAARIYAALSADPNYYYQHVDVRVDNGIAQLSGYIWSVNALNRAKQIAAGIPGVTGVVDQMELERNGNRGGGHSGTG